MRILLAASIAALSAFPAGATTFYVSTTGSDAQPGTLVEPWATIQHAVENVGPGDEIFVRGGSYAGARIETSGTAAQPIRLAAFPGETAILDSVGPGNAHGSLLEIETWDPPGIVSWWVVEGLETIGGVRSGIDLRNVHHVTIRDNVVHDAGLTGIFTAFADDVLIEGNRSFDNGEHGIYHSNSGDRPVIRRNVLIGNFAAGIHLNADAGQGGDGIISEALIERNEIRNNGLGGGAGINLDGVTDSTIANNLIVDAHASGIAVFQQDGAACSQRNLIAHNTVHTSSTGRWGLVMPDPGCVDNTIVANTFWSDHSFRGAIAVWTASPPGLVARHNAVEDRFSTDGGNTVIDFAAWQGLGHGSGSVVADPAQLYVDAAAGDYHLADGSPAVDLAPDAGIAQDLEGAPRPQGAAFDAGAYERGGGIFADGFESGDTSAWSAVAPLEISPAFGR